MRIFKQLLLTHGNFVLAIFIPMILLPILFIRTPLAQCTSGDGEQKQDCDDNGDGSRVGNKLQCAYVIALMAVYWITEAIPLAVTALLPVALFPFFGILDTARVAQAYMKETGMMLISSLIVVLALEYCKLHTRIALRVMTCVGRSDMGLLLGVMITTAFLSMWMSNTATTAMMIPIVLAVVDELHDDKDPMSGQPSEATVRERDCGLDQNCRTQQMSAAKLSSKKMYLLGLSYAAKIGGNGTIIASPPNLIFQELIREVDVTKGGKHLDINFSTWMALNVPGVLLNLLFTWLYLMAVYFPTSIWGMSRSLFQSRDKSNFHPTMDVDNQRHRDLVLHFKTKYKELGPISFHEVVVGLLFVTLAILWFTRKPGFMPGWGQYILGVKVGDSSAAMLIAAFLFIIPKHWPFSEEGRQRLQESVRDRANVETALNWGYVHDKLPWGTVFLIGAGYAISDASIKTGLSAWIAEGMNELVHLPPWTILLVTMITITLTTEVISNTACANIFLPILIAMSQHLSLHPLYLTLPATNACIYSFMLPSASGSSSLVFAAGKGDLRIWDMIKNGIFLNILCVAVFFLLNITYGNWLFGYDTYTVN